MNAFVAVYLAQDGIANGLVYALLGTAIVLLFSVTRVIFIPIGEYVTFAALTFVALAEGRTPGVIYFLLALIGTHFIVDVLVDWRRRRLAPLVYSSLVRVAGPLAVAALTYVGCQIDLPLWSKAVFAVAVTAATAPLLYRLVYQPIADASVLVLMIVSMAVHFVLIGFGLYMFGPTGQRSPPLLEGNVALLNVPISHQTIVILAVTLLTIGGLYFVSRKTLYGKAMLAVAIHRSGARLMGISSELAGRLSFLVAGAIGATCGVLIAPITPVLYDTGLTLGLKGFVGAILGGLVSYPVAALGGVLIGLLESYSAFFASGYKEVIVFSLVIPILMARSIWTRTEKEEEADEGPSDLCDEMDAPTRRRKRLIVRILGFGFVGAVILAPMLASDYDLALLSYVGLSAIVALGIVLLTGVVGLTSFSQAAYVGIGAYVTGFLTTQIGISPWVALVGVFSVAVPIALLNSMFAVRLSGHYLPLATIAVAISAYYLFGNLPGLGGQSGMSDIPPLALLGYELRDPKSFYIVIWAVLLLLLLGTGNLLDSRPGRALRSLRYGTIMGEGVGINTQRLKIASFVIACLMAALAGWLYAHFQRFLNPSPFSFNQGIEYVFMAVIGGAGSVFGAITGATIVVLSNQWLQSHLPKLIGIQGDFQIIVFGVLAVIVLQFMKEGVWPVVARFARLNLPNDRPSVDAKPLTRRDKPSPGNPILSVRNVDKMFGGLAANKQVSLDVVAGEILALIGPNGAGKSTLFDIISGVLSPTAGSVSFLGRETSHSARALALGGMARTYQHVRIVPDMTVIENVALGAHARLKTGFMKAALRFDQREEAMLLAEARIQLARVGLLNVAYRSAGSLSLGQQRLMEIARALCSDPSLLLLDEPAAGLRLLEKNALAKLLAELKAEHMAILIVEHDMDFVMNLADRVVVLQFGQKLAEGTPQQIQANPEVIEAYLGGVE